MNVPHPATFLARWLVAAALLFVSLGAPAAEDRVALVIGNNNYGSSPLRNAVNDAHDLGEALKELGFKVILRENATRKDMIDAIREFGTAIEGANVALFFYAGHGMQFKDRNYLIPVDIAMGSEEDVTFFALDVQQVFDRMDRARTRFNFIILDACRDNPFASSFKVSSAGLAQMSAPSGTLIAYATAPGALAQDGFGRNGIYTKHILNNIRVPDVPVEIMFKRVREGVERETLKKQTPWDSSSLKGDFAFNPTAQRVAGASSSSPSADVALTLEREFWASARESNRPEDIQAYLDKYPKGTFSQLARNRLDSIAKLARATPAPASIPAPAVAPAREPVKVAEAPKAVQRTGENEKPREAATGAAVVEKADEAPHDKVAAKPAEPAPHEKRPAEEKPVVVAAAAPATAAAQKREVLEGREIAAGIREVTFPDGAIYRGGFQGALLHGKGEYVAKNFRYEGEFREGRKEGQGTYVWANGNRYEGPFAADAPNGVGKYSFANGDVYTGEIRDGALTGRGTYVSKSGDALEGTFVNGTIQGVGTQRFASGDRYEGEFKDGRASGKGRYLGADGHRVEGEFVDGLPHGKGVHSFANGDRYEGDIDHSALTGRGAYFYKSGAKYEGKMLNGQPSGEGRFWFSDGSHFDGTFENGLAKARGTMVGTDGSTRAAQMVDGQVVLVQ